MHYPYLIFSIYFKCDFKRYRSASIFLTISLSYVSRNGLAVSQPVSASIISRVNSSSLSGEKIITKITGGLALPFDVPENVEHKLPNINNLRPRIKLTGFEATRPCTERSFKPNVKLLITIEQTF